MDHFCYLCLVFAMLSCLFSVALWERAYLLALLYVMFYCIFVTFPCGVLGQMWYLIVSIPDFCLLTFMFVMVRGSLCLFYLIFLKLPMKMK